MKKGNKAFCVLCYEPCNSGIYYFTQILLLQVVTQIKTRLDKAADFKKQDADFSHLSCAQGGLDSTSLVLLLSTMLPQGREVCSCASGRLGWRDCAFDSLLG